MKKSLLDVFYNHSPKNSGDNQIRMSCPFEENHKDGSGRVSFFASPDINAYHCFSCKESGKLTSLLTSKFGLGFSEAYEYVDIDSYVSGKKKPKKKKLLEKDYYSLTPPKFYTKRGLKPETLKSFMVGSNDESYVIPWIEYGIVVGYLYRDMLHKHKYALTIPRGEHIYNLKKGMTSAILVEGPADVWRLTDWGLYAIALGGTETSKGAIEKLKDFDTLYFAFDNDDAGIRAADKLYNEIRNHVEVLFIPYYAEDPEKEERSVFFKGYSEPADYLDFKMNFYDTLESD